MAGSRCVRSIRYPFLAGTGLVFSERCYGAWEHQAQIPWHERHGQTDLQRLKAHSIRGEARGRFLHNRSLTPCLRYWPILVLTASL